MSNLLSIFTSIFLLAVGSCGNFPVYRSYSVTICGMSEQMSWVLLEHYEGPHREGEEPDMLQALRWGKTWVMVTVRRCSQRSGWRQVVWYSTVGTKGTSERVFPGQEDEVTLQRIGFEEQFQIISMAIGSGSNFLFPLYNESYWMEILT